MAYPELTLRIAATTSSKVFSGVGVGNGGGGDSVCVSPAGICASSCPSTATSEGPSGREHPVVALKTLTSANDARR